MYNLIIPAAGHCRRLGNLTAGLQKLFLPFGNGNVLDYILGANPQAEKVIVVLREKDQSSRDYLERNYPDVVIANNPYEDSQPGYSVICGLHLANTNQKTRVWLSDTVLKFPPNPPDEDAIYTSNVDDSSQWCIYLDGFYYNKVMDGPGYALIGIYDFEDTKKALDRAKDKGIKTEISEILPEKAKDRDVGLSWIDTGTIRNYFEAQSVDLGKPRHFNKMYCSDDYTINKSCASIEAASAEYQWLKFMDKHLPGFAPRPISHAAKDYKMERVWGVTAADWLISNWSWELYDWLLDMIFDDMEKLHGLNIGINLSLCDKEVVDYMFTDKSLDGLDDYISDASIQKLRSLPNTNITHESQPLHPIHGDIHLGNIIIDPRRGFRKYVDPRGIWGKEITPYGCIGYDYAKLAHDMAHGYSWIIRGKKKPKGLIERFTEALQLRVNSLYIKKKEVLGQGAILLANAAKYQKDQKIANALVTEALRYVG